MSQYIIKYYNSETGKQFTDLTKYSSKSHAIANLNQEFYSRIEEVESEEDMHDNLNKIFEFFCFGSGCDNCFRRDECYGEKCRHFEDYSLGEKIKLCAKMVEQYCKRKRN